MTKPTILVAAGSEGLIAVSADGRVQEIAKELVRGLAADGRGGALAIVGSHSLHKRGSDGRWAAVATSKFELSCCVAVGNTIYVGTDDARMLRLNRGSGLLEPIESFDHVAGRDAWFAGSAIVNGQRLGPPLGIRSLAASCDGRILFANVHVGGIPRSTDGGKTWQPTIDIDTDVHEVCAHPSDPDFVVAAAAVGLCISRDGGAAWTVEREGLHAPHCSAVAISGDDIFVSAATDPFAAQGRVYRRPIRPDGTLTAVEGGMPAWTDGKVDTGSIATNGPFLAMADRGGNLFGSDDYGRTWCRWIGGLPAPSGILFA